MNFKFFPSKTFSAMEIGAGSVRIVVADRKDNGELRLLGGSEAPAQGLEKGEIRNLGDLAECVIEASEKAAKSAGAAIEKLYYNLDDPEIESVWRTGAKILDGEGEIQAADVRAAAQAARRLAGNFEKKIVYGAEVDYTIDDKDPVMDPVGVFGHKLDVKVHLLLARAARCDQWRRLLRRAGFSRTAPVLSGLSSAYGVLTPEERRGRRIVWDIGADYLNGLVLDNGRIREYRTLVAAEDGAASLSGVVLALCQEFQKKCPGITEAVLTGERCRDEKLSAELKGLDVPVRTALPWGVAKLSEAGHASTAGLLRIAAEKEKKSTVIQPEKNNFAGAREKVRSFLSDYF